MTTTMPSNSPSKLPPGNGRPILVSFDFEVFRLFSIDRGLISAGSLGYQIVETDEEGIDTMIANGSFHGKVEHVPYRRKHEVMIGGRGTSWRIGYYLSDPKYGMTQASFDCVMSYTGQDKELQYLSIPSQLFQ